MTFDISRFPEPEDYGEVLLRLMASPNRRTAPAFPGAESLPGVQPGDALILVGEMKGELSGSLYKREWLGLKNQTHDSPLPVNFEIKKKNSDFVRSLLEQSLLNALCEVYDGGIGCAAAEMALKCGVGVQISYFSYECEFSNEAVSLLQFLFAEDACRYLIAVQSDYLDKIRLDRDDDFWATQTRVGWFEEDTNIVFDDIQLAINNPEGYPSIPLSTLRDAMKP